MTRITTQTFVDRAKLVHGKRYDYSKTEFVSSLRHVTIICPKHGKFYQQANSHLMGHGCAYCTTHTGHVYDYMQKLNEDNGWNLIGGNQEFSIPSNLTPSGRYRFDGCDIDKRVFFEYNDKPHAANSVKSRDSKKKERLKEFLKEQNLGTATYVVYDAIKDILSTETIN